MVWVTSLPALVVVVAMRERLSVDAFVVALGVVVVILAFSRVHTTIEHAVLSSAIVGVHLLAGVALL